MKSWSTVRAIRYVKEHIRGREKLRGLSDAALQVRYTEASKYWALFLNPKECWAVIEQQDASLSRIATAVKRAKAAWARVNITAHDDDDETCPGLSVRQSDFP